MIFTKTVEYAIRVMVYLAEHKQTRFSVNHLHKELNIPYKYLGRLMSKLATEGLVEVQKGKQGGFRLNAERSPIYLYEIIKVAEDLDTYNRCILGFEDCSDDNPCSMHHIWSQQKQEIQKIIYNTTINDLDHLENIKY